jgi:hypothetical protein
VRLRSNLGPPHFFADTDDYEDWIQMHTTLVKADIRRYRLKAQFSENAQQEVPVDDNRVEQSPQSRFVIKQSDVQKLED